ELHAGTVMPDMSYLKAKNNDLQDLNFDNSGARVQAGVMLLPARLELVGRLAQVDRKADADFRATRDAHEENQMREARLGLNWYFSKHDWKWQFDVGEINTELKYNGQKLETPRRSDFAGGVGFDDKVITRNTRKDKEFRTQFQIQF